MNPRLYNVCVLLGWLMVTGGVALEKGVGVGLATGGGLLLVLTLASVYLAGPAPAKPAAGEDEAR